MICKHLEITGGIVFLEYEYIVTENVGGSDKRIANR